MGPLTPLTPSGHLPYLGNKPSRVTSSSSVNAEAVATTV